MRPLLCLIGRHRWVDLPKPKSHFMRMFVVRRVRGCLRCGRCRVNRFSNVIGGGGTVDSWLSEQDLLQIRQEHECTVPISGDTR